MKIIFKVFTLVLLIANVSAASSSFLIRDQLKNYVNSPDYNVLSCTAPSSYYDYTFVIAKKRNEHSGPVGLFNDFQGPEGKNILLDTSGLPAPYHYEWKSFKSHAVNPNYGMSHARYWFVVKWSNESGSELLPDFEIRVFMQRPIPYLYPEVDNLDSVLKCKLKN